MATIIVGAALAGVVALSIISIVKKKKSGECTCGANCGGCPGCDAMSQNRK